MGYLETLRAVADIWVDVHGRTDERVSLRTLGVRSVNNAKLFDRAEMTVGTFEKVVGYLAEPRSWPAASIPDAALALLDPFVVDGAREPV